MIKMDKRELEATYGIEKDGRGQDVRGTRGGVERSEKRMKKRVKKVLTKEVVFDIMSKLSRGNTLGEQV